MKKKKHFSFSLNNYCFLASGSWILYSCICVLRHSLEHSCVVQCLPCSSCGPTTPTAIWYWSTWSLGKMFLKIQPRDAELHVFNPIDWGRGKYSFPLAYIHWKTVAAARERGNWRWVGRGGAISLSCNNDLILHLFSIVYINPAVSGLWTVLSYT